MSPSQQVGLFGFGTVGRGYYEVSLGNDSPFVTPDAIVVKTPGKKRSLPEDYFSLDANRILNDKNIRTVVELTGATNEACVIISRAFAEKKAVVSANKKVIAENYPDLVRNSRINGNVFLYEAAVAASVPILRLLDDYFSHQILTSVRGILNGTSNYILSQIRREGLSYQQALKKAQELGFAESDPASDVEGWDATYKLVILAAHAFGYWTPPAQVPRLGITLITGEDIAFAESRGLRIRLVASAEITSSGKIQLLVLPRFVAANDPLYQVEDEYNGIVVESESAGTQFYQGRGAGSSPTGTAVLWDVLAAAEGKKYKLQKFLRGNAPEAEWEQTIPLLIALGNSTPESLSLKPEWINHSIGKYQCAEIPVVYLRAVLNAAVLRNVSVIHADVLTEKRTEQLLHLVPELVS